MPAGRPTDYKPEFVEQARKLCELGATDVELADFFGVERTSIWRWSQKYPEFSNALKVGKEAADERVIRSLYAKATGYTHDAVKIFNDNGQALVVPYREHVAPDTTAAIFWLKNRRSKDWRDKVEHGVTDNEGNDVAATDPLQLARAIGFALAQAKALSGKDEDSE